MSVLLSQLCRVASEIPKSLAICKIGASCLQGTKPYKSGVKQTRVAPTRVVAIFIMARTKELSNFDVIIANKIRIAYPRHWLDY